MEEPSKPLDTLRAYPQAWMLSLTGFGLSATWTALVTFLPTLWADKYDIPIVIGGVLLGFLYFVLVPGCFFSGYVSRRTHNRGLLLWIPAVLNVILGIAITLTPNAYGIAALLTCMGLLWVVVPIWHVMPFEFPGIRPREVAVVSALFWTFSALGFAMGPLITGFVSDMTGSLETGLIVATMATSIGIVSGLLYTRFSSSLKLRPKLRA